MLTRLIFATTLLLAASAQATSLSAVNFNSLDQLDGKPLSIKGWWWPSELPGKQPTVIAMHGCGGIYAHKSGEEFNPRHQNMAQLLHKQGYNVLFPDSFTPRGARSICSTKYNERSITVDNRRLDVQGALRWAGSQASVDPARIALLGWSNGGSTTLNTLNQSRPDQVTPAPRAAVAFYPGCGSYIKPQAHYQLKTPLLILVGASDDWTPPEACQKLESLLKPAPITVRLFADSYHDFDMPGLAKKVRADVPNGAHPGQGVTVAGNPVAAEAAYKEMLAFFARELK